MILRGIGSENVDCRISYGLTICLYEHWWITFTFHNECQQHEIQPVLLLPDT